MIRRLLRRLSGTSAPIDPALRQWRTHAEALARDGTAPAIQDFLASTETLLAAEDTEIDRERLEARLDVLALDARLAAGDVPFVDTQHKAIGGDVCRRLAPAVLVGADGDQPGKLFVTDTALRFAGGGTVTIKWSAVLEVTTVDRDLLVSTRGSNGLHRFRCNTFSDALVFARLIDHLRDGRRGGDGSGG